MSSPSSIPVNREPNSRPPIIRQVFANLFDMVVMFFVHYGLYTLILLTPIVSTLNGYKTDIIKIQDTYKLESGYGEKVVTEKGKEDSYILYTDTDGTTYTVHYKDYSSDKEALSKAYKSYIDLINKDDSYQEKTTYYHIHNYLITAVMCGGIVEAIFLLMVPLVNKKRQTLGMMIFHLSYFSTTNEELASWKNILIRVLFTYVIESLLPYYFLAQWTMLVVPLVLGGIALLNENHRTLHDFVSQVRVIDSYTYEPLYEYENSTEESTEKKEVH